MARKNILTPKPALASPEPRVPPAPVKPVPRGAVGALQSSLSKLQENAVQDLDTALIDDAGIEDRLESDSTAQAALRESLATYGQQVPVLVRPHPSKSGRFEIVYGRRRVQALKDLGIPVKAMIRQLDDHALVLAQGQENTSRKDLSFIEKASFAAQLQEAGYDRETVAAALSIDQPMVSRMLKVGKAFTLEQLKKIGAAPGIGRDRWMALVKLFEAPGAKSHALGLLTRPELRPMSSDARFEAVFERAAGKGKTAPRKAPAPRKLRAADGSALGDIRSGRKGITLTITAQDGFAAWLETEADTVIQDLHTRWKTQQDEDREL